MRVSTESGVAAPASRDSVWRGLAAGLAPLVLLVLTLTATVLLVTLARLLSETAGADFFTTRLVVVIVLAAGGLAACGLYARACLGALRSARVLREAGLSIEARAVLWALGVTAVAVLVPVVLAVVWPQHPVPPAE